MNKSKVSFAGIDISFKTFNVYYGGDDLVYSNDRRGWNKFLKVLRAGAILAMEATGYYHYKLASYFKSKGFDVMVFNPGKLRSYVNSLPGNRAKNDKVDAKSIWRFACRKEALEWLWKPAPAKLARARAIVTLLCGLAKLRKSSRNLNHSVGLVVEKSDPLLGVMACVGDVCKDSEESLLLELCEIVKGVCPEQFDLLCSIPGFGAKSAACFLVCIKDIGNFDSCSKLSSYLGLVSEVSQSGTSVKGKSRITKSGNVYLRSLLFMAALNAARCNPVCLDLYGRLVARGKPKMVANVAVMHRLVKIAFGVLKSGENFKGGFAKKVA
jgi:transposase